MAGFNRQAGQGKMAQHRLWARVSEHKKRRIRANVVEAFCIHTAGIVLRSGEGEEGEQ
jgi:hypothetical protein